MTGMPRRASGRRRRLFWTDRALADLEATGDYISRDDPRAAESWVAQLIALFERAASAPLAGRRVPELGREDVREVLRRTYRLVYRNSKDRLEVLTVLEGHRLFPADLPKRLKR